MTPRLTLAHLPTPLERLPRLSSELGVDLWIKRDDASGGVEAGNKIRKLEFLLGAACAEVADVVITCGALQSNHCRATAAACARLGLGCVVLLRVADPSVPAPLEGNVLLMRMLGAEIRLVTPVEYADRSARMASVADEHRARGKRPYVIPEGGSNALGSLGYVEAMREIREQLDLGLGGRDRFDVVVHACGSGGTAAGVALGCAVSGVAPRVLAIAVCDSSAYFTSVADRIVAEARSVDPLLPAPVTLDVDDRFKGPAYGVASAEQRAFVVAMARSHGLVLDPVYTGKALFGLAGAIAADPALKGARVLFLHTGGLPGLLAAGSSLAGELG